MEERKGGFIDWAKSSLGSLTEWALSSALKATHGLFGSKSADGGKTTINQPKRTISQIKTPGTGKRAEDHIVELKKRK